MHRDVQRKLDRLCEEYATAQARIELQRFVSIPRLRQQRRAEQALRESVGKLGEARKARCVPLVRLAYVRAMREISPGATLGGDQEEEVRRLVRRFRKGLMRAETDTIMQFRRHTRLLIAAQSMKAVSGLDTAPQALKTRTLPVPLEQRARTVATSIVQEAHAAGTLAGNRLGSYDGRV